MADEHDCTACSTGCEARRTPESTMEEIGAGGYLLMCAVMMVAVSLLARWLW